jgi:hypothetical protein
MIQTVLILTMDFTIDRISNYKNGDWFCVVAENPQNWLFSFGILIKLDPPMILEHDYDGRHMMTVDEFLYGEDKLWEITFATERRLYGDNVFRSPKERAIKAIQLFKEARPYCAETFNCEHFVRECVFNQPELWTSPQVQHLKSNEVGLIGRLTIAILGIAPETEPRDGKESILNKSNSSTIPLNLDSFDQFNLLKTP